MSMQKKHRIILTAVIFLMVSGIISCRKMDDPVISYGYNDSFAFMEVGKSFTNQFKAFWTAMNSNYNIWDYEWDQGYNWDDVYDKYLPIFEQFDREYDKNTNRMPSETLNTIYEEILSPLHDGHFYAEIKNIHTGERLKFSPGENRSIKELGENEYYSEVSLSPSLKAYSNLPESDSRHCDIFAGGIFRNLPEGSEFLADYINSSILHDILFFRSYYPLFPYYFDAETTEHLIDFFENQMIRRLTEANAIFESDLSPDEQLEKYYQFYYDYIQDLENSPENIAVFDYKAPLDGSTYSMTGNEEYFKLYRGFEMNSAVINEEIPYLQISSFSLFPFFEPGFIDRYSSTRGMSFSLRRLVKTWRKWFDNIQRLSADGKLKGVIIDLRSNYGGYTNDIKYITGALTNTCVPFGYFRYKEGPGRFDYSPMVAFEYPIFEESHVDVKVPIVFLVNHISASMSEVIPLSVSEFADVSIVGTSTCGAFSSMQTDLNSYSLMYSSCVGNSGSSPFYLNICYSTFVDKNKKILEGIGLTPSPENYIEMDWKTFYETGMDNQFERALDIINGK